MLLLLCRQNSSAQSKDTTSLAGTWYLQAVLPSDTATGKTPWLYFNLQSTSYTGNSGCNSMHGKFYYSQTDSSFAFANKVAIARNACAGYNEPAFLKSLSNTEHYKLQNNTLIFVGDNKAELSHWTRKKEAPAKAIKT